MGAHLRARSRETVSGAGPEPGGKQGGALCPPAPGLAEARGRGGRAAVASARARALAPARPASSVFVLMEPACSWRVSSHVSRPRGGWALAARTPGRAQEGSQPRALPENSAQVRSCGAGRSYFSRSSGIWVRRHSIPASQLSPGLEDQLRESNGPHSCVTTGLGNLSIWLFIQAARYNQPETFKIIPSTQSL